MTGREKVRAEVIVLHETVLDSVLKDACSFVTIAAVIGFGRWIGSPLMEDLGFLMLVILGLGLAFLRKKYHMTVPEARRLLDEIDLRRASGR